MLASDLHCHFQKIGLEPQRTTAPSHHRTASGYDTGARGPAVQLAVQLVGQLVGQLVQLSAAQLAGRPDMYILRVRIDIFKGPSSFFDLLGWLLD